MKEIFLFVGGATPQIITETIYALAHRAPPIHPDVVAVITTSTGRGLIKKRLAESKALEGMSREFGIPALRLRDLSFIVAADKSGRELDDIRDENDNEIIADVTTTVVRDLTLDEDTRLHCSISGGRKTMSFYLGTALQLFGRPRDRLYHVLVSPEFESNQQFFYKPRRNKILETRRPDGSIARLNTRDARIDLAELPFIRLRDKLGPESGSFLDLMAESQNKLDTDMIQPQITVNLSERALTIGAQSVRMGPVHFMVYASLLRRKTDHCMHGERTHCEGCRDCFGTIYDLSAKENVKRMFEDYRRMHGGNPYRAEELLAQWKEKIVSDIIRQAISKINRAIREAIGDSPYLPCALVESLRKYGDTRYGVNADKGKIWIAGE